MSADSSPNRRGASFRSQRSSGQRMTIEDAIGSPRDLGGSSRYTKSEHQPSDVARSLRERQISAPVQGHDSFALPGGRRHRMTSNGNVKTDAALRRIDRVSVAGFSDLYGAIVFPDYANRLNEREDPAEAARLKRLRRCHHIKQAIIWTLVATALIYLVVDFAIHGYVRKRFDDFTEWMKNDGGAYALLAFIAIVYFGNLVLLPGSVLAIGGGFAFGTIYGGVAGTAVATGIMFVVGNFSAYSAFLLSRHVFRESMLRWIVKKKVITAIVLAMGSQGVKIMSLIRLSVLIPNEPINYVFGATAVTTKEFMIALLAFLPRHFAFCVIGASLASVQNDSDHDCDSDSDSDDEEDMIGGGMGGSMNSTLINNGTSTIVNGTIPEECGGPPDEGVNPVMIGMYCLGAVLTISIIVLIGWYAKRQLTDAMHSFQDGQDLRRLLDDAIQPKPKRKLVRRYNACGHPEVIDVFDRGTGDLDLGDSGDDARAAAAHVLADEEAGTLTTRTVSAHPERFMNAEQSRMLAEHAVNDMTATSAVEAGPEASAPVRADAEAGGAQGEPLPATGALAGTMAAVNDSRQNVREPVKVEDHRDVEAGEGGLSPSDSGLEAARRRCEQATANRNRSRRWQRCFDLSKHLQWQFQNVHDLTLQCDVTYEDACVGTSDPPDEREFSIDVSGRFDVAVHGAIDVGSTSHRHLDPSLATAPVSSNSPAAGPPSRRGHPPPLHASKYFTRPQLGGTVSSSHLSVIPGSPATVSVGESGTPVSSADQDSQAGEGKEGERTQQPQGSPSVSENGSPDGRDVESTVDSDRGSVGEASTPSPSPSPSPASASVAATARSPNAGQGRGTKLRPRGRGRGRSRGAKQSSRGPSTGRGGRRGRSGRGERGGGQAAAGPRGQQERV